MTYETCTIRTFNPDSDQLDEFLDDLGLIPSAIVETEVDSAVTSTMPWEHAIAQEYELIEPGEQLRGILEMSDVEFLYEHDERDNIHYVIRQ
ncbi:hypothetical protein [Halosegnis longus]|uniref:hypothetical protein n=1 Tax=Halosegnis longus TaxID=2216012 RepID=UPI00129E02CC|nr:hypothetical protein [Halosegnis longus]